MEKREDALRQDIAKNDEDTIRWESYVKDNETAIENINMFSKRLTVDVMVPIGKRALMPGRLIHTNEVLVGHYQDYFSKCSAFTATEICKNRIQNGKTHLLKLEAEKDLLQNKLEKPYLEGVLPNSEEREIIEEYDEEKEKIWKQEHRQRVRKEKLEEKQKRDEMLSKEESDNALLEALEHEGEEMLEELNDELAGLEIDTQNNTQEILNKLMTGTMSLPPPKKRISHSEAVKRDDAVELKPIEPKAFVQSIKSMANDTVNLSISNKLHLQQNIEAIVDGNESDTSIASDTPEEIRLIEKQAEYLPHEDRIGFYQYQLQIVDQQICTRTFSNNKELIEKMQLFKIRDHLEELIDILGDTDSQPADDIEKLSETEQVPSSNPPKRRISFALEDQMLEFRKNETVASMMSIKTPMDEKPPRDIICLDEPTLTQDKTEEQNQNDPNKIIDRRKTIIEKVEENLKTQCLENADLVNKIIDSSTIQTLHIHFKHSTEEGAKSDETEIPATPADLYKLICQEENHEPPPPENTNEKAYIDLRSKFLSPAANENTSTETQSRSILRNKSAVELETHTTESNEKPIALQKRSKKTKTEEEHLSAYNKVMGDVIENPTTPDPLPEGNFIDMHTPKKRVSRFKKMRNENK